MRPLSLMITLDCPFFRDKCRGRNCTAWVDYDTEQGSCGLIDPQRRDLEEESNYTAPRVTSARRKKRSRPRPPPPGGTRPLPDPPR